MTRTRALRVAATGLRLALGAVVGSMMLAAPASAVLPDGRGYELVSPADKSSNDVIGLSSRTQVAKNEAPGLPSAVTFASFGAFGDVQGTGVATEYLSQRDGQPGTSGWSTHAITPQQDPLSYVALSQGNEPLYQGPMSSDLTKGIFRAWSPLTDAPNVADVMNLYMRDDLRTPGHGTYRLLTDAATPLSPLAPGPTPLLPRPVVAGASPDLRHVVFEDRADLTADATGNNMKLYKADEGVVRLLSDGSDACPGVPPVFGLGPDKPCSAAGLGATLFFRAPRLISAEGSRVTFTSPVDLLGTAGPQSAIYQLDDQGTPTQSDDALAQINASEKDAPDAPQPATYQIASSDGSRVFFTSEEQLTNTPGGGLYMWERQATNESQSVSVDATGGTFTLTAHTGPVDATTAPISVGATAADVQAALEALRPIGTGNVEVAGGAGAPYAITFVGALAGVNVRQLTADGSALTGGLATVTVATTQPVRNLTLLSPGNGPGTVGGVIGSSEDGHYVYFTVDGGDLVPGGPEVRESAIYLWHDETGSPTLSFVGGIPGGTVHELIIDSPYNLIDQRARVTPDGRALAFESQDGAGLAPRYQHGVCGSVLCRELYHYAAATSTPTSPDVVCASCDLAVPAASGQTLMDLHVGQGLTQGGSHQNRIVTDDGRRVFFSTNKALVPEDVNGKDDAYEYDVPSRTVHLLSSGMDASDSYFMDASGDGHDAYILTREQLVGWDRDQATDIYDVRIGGGFPDPPSAAQSCDGDACQGLPPVPPLAVAPGTKTFKGVGNASGHLRHHRKARCHKSRTKKHARTRRCVARRHRSKAKASLGHKAGSSPLRRR